MEVALIGGAPSSRHRIDQLDKGVQRWSLGMCYRFFSPFDLWFECHKKRVWEDTWYHPETKQHFAWLRSCPVPVMMREDFGDVPGRMPYPEDEVIAHLGQRYHAIGEAASRWEYITGGPNWMLAYAIWHNAHKEKIDKLHVIGINMDAMEEYFFQKGSFEHLLGIAMGEGIDVYIPPESPLLKGELYGTQKTHESVAPFEMMDLKTDARARYHSKAGGNPALSDREVIPVGQAKQKRLAVLTAVRTREPIPISETSRERLLTLNNELNGALMILRAASVAVETLRAHFNREAESLMTALGVPRGQSWQLDLDNSLLVPNQEPSDNGNVPKTPEDLNG